MSVLMLLIPLSLVLAGGFLAAFIWAVRSGQYEDTWTPSLRLMFDDPPVRPPGPTVTSSEAPASSNPEETR